MGSRNTRFGPGFERAASSAAWSPAKGFAGAGLRSQMAMQGIWGAKWPYTKNTAANRRVRFWGVLLLSFLVLIGLIHSARSSRQKASSVFRGGQACPLSYPRLSIDEVRKGVRPYIYGGVPPGCKACASSDFVAQLCQFNVTGNGTCEKYKVGQLIAAQLELGFNSILTFTPCDLFALIRGRMLYFTGDSQTQDFVKAVQCFMFPMTDMGWHAFDSFGTVDKKRTSGFMWHENHGCVVMPGNTRLCFKRCDDYACLVNEVVPFLLKAGKSEDFLIANIGLHFSPDYEGELRNLTSQVDELRRTGSFPRLLWKDTPPQHFGTYFGEYPQNPGKPPFTCKAIGLEDKPEGQPKWQLQRDHTIKVLHPEWEEIARGGWRNAAANKVMAESGVPVIHTWNDTVTMYDYHRDNGAGHECTHFCLPSAPQVWVHALYQTLLKVEAGSASKTARGKLRVLLDADAWP